MLVRAVTTYPSFIVRYLQTVAHQLSATFRMNVLFISCAHAHTNYRIPVVVGSSALIAFLGNEQAGIKLRRVATISFTWLADERRHTIIVASHCQLSAAGLNSELFRNSRPRLSSCRRPDDIAADKRFTSVTLAEC